MGRRRRRRRGMALADEDRVKWVPVPGKTCRTCGTEFWLNQSFEDCGLCRITNKSRPDAARDSQGGSHEVHL